MTETDNTIGVYERKASEKVWDWEEAFEKFGFDDGDGWNGTDLVADFLRRHGYTVECNQWGCHNYIIDHISKAEEKIYVLCEYPVMDELSEPHGYANPRDYIREDIAKLLDKYFGKMTAGLSYQFIHEPIHTPTHAAITFSKDPSDQEILDSSYNFMINQGKPATNMEGGCLYRSYGGYMCALGALIPDDFYVIEMEGKDIADLFSNHELPEWMAAHQELLSEIQNAHDMSTHSIGFKANKATYDYTDAEAAVWLKEFEIRILRICKENGLNHPSESTA